MSTRAIFKYSKGGEREMSIRDAKILEKLKLGTYMTRDMRAGVPEFPNAKVVKPEPVVDLELDSAGFAWDAELHAESRAKNKDGTWRKRPGGAKAE
jgi:hypothetical protein